jgi:hypothetical protein
VLQLSDPLLQGVQDGQDDGLGVRGDGVPERLGDRGVGAHTVVITRLLYKLFETVNGYTQGNAARRGRQSDEASNQSQFTGNNVVIRVLYLAIRLSVPVLILLANSSRASGNPGFAFPARLIPRSFGPNDSRREFANSIPCCSRACQARMGTTKPSGSVLSSGPNDS